MNDNPMLQKFIARYSNRFLSKWIVLIFDVCSTVLMFLLAVFLRFNFDYSQLNPRTLEKEAFFIGGIYTIGFLLTQSFAGIIRHTSVSDAARIIKGSFFAFFGLMILSTLYATLGYSSDFGISRSILIIHFLLTIF